MFCWKAGLPSPGCSGLENAAKRLISLTCSKLCVFGHASLQRVRPTVPSVTLARSAFLSSSMTVQVKEGVNVYRFANRIPLLFEGGSDVVTRVAMKRIKWVVSSLAFWFWPCFALLYRNLSFSSPRLQACADLRAFLVSLYPCSVQ